MKNEIRLSGFESEYKFTRRVMDMVSRGYEVIKMGTEDLYVELDSYTYGDTKILRGGKSSKKHWAVLRRVEAQA